jgi:hypothetical protein
MERKKMASSKLGWSCVVALVGSVAAACGSSSNNGESDGGGVGVGAVNDGSTSVTDSGSAVTDGGSDGGTTLCCNKLTDNTGSCTGDAMTNDECTCLPVPAGTSCAAALPDAGPIVSACTGYPCCFTLNTGGCQCVSAGDIASCYGAEASCAAIATANGGTMSSSCP